MTEGTKALNSSVSTLKKNPGRIGRLVKAAKLLIVPPKQYTTGKARVIAEAAVRKLKAKRGLNGVVGEGAGPFSDKALQKSAADKKDAVGAAALGATGTAAGLAVGRNLQQHKNIMRSYDRNTRKINSGERMSKVYRRAETFDRRAAKTVKGAGRRGALIGGVAGVLTGLAARKVEKQMEKKAVDKETKDRALAASGVASGAALGGVLTHDAKKSRVTSRMATKGAYKHMGDASIDGAEKRLANSAKTMRRMGKPLRRAGIKGAIAGGLAGAALGAAHLKKEAGEKGAVAGGVAGGVAAGLATKAVAKHVIAKNTKFRGADTNVKTIVKGMRNGNDGMRRALRILDKAKGKHAKIVEKASRRMGVIGGAAGALLGSAAGASIKGKKMEKTAGVPATIPKQQFLGKGKVPAGAKDVSPKAVLKRKAGKAGKIAVGVAAAAALAGAAKKHMEKKAEKKKDSNVAGAAIGAGSVAYTVRSTKDGAKGMKGVRLQHKYLLSKGHRPSPMDFHMAMDTLNKPIARRAAKAGLKASAVGALAGAAYDHLKGHKKQAAEKIKHEGKTARRGTVTSAATTMGGVAGALTALGRRKNPKGMLQDVARTALSAGAMGGTYGVARKALRTARGEKSMSPREFDKAKKLQKQAAEMITRDGKKYRKGTPVSAMQTMMGVNTGMQIASNMSGREAARRFGTPVARSHLIKDTHKALVGGAIMGYGYGKIREHFRKKRGEESLNAADFKAKKAS